MNKRNPKVRRRDYTTDVYDNYEYNADQSIQNKVDRIKFQNNETDIMLDRKINCVFTSGRCCVDAFSMSLLMSPDFWHSVTVHHQGLFTKGEISAGLEEMVENVYFIPVAYISGRNEDTFYVYNQSNALQNMINKNLETIVTNKSLRFTLKLGVANFVKGQLNPIEKIDIAIADIISKYRELRLDFSYFDKHRAFIDMQFSLKNYGCFDVFCDRLLYALQVDMNRNVLTSLKILVLVGNKIKNLQPLSKLSKCRSLQNISLKNNLVESIEEFEALKQLNLKAISVAGNAVISNNESIIANKIIQILPTLEKLDIKRKNDLLDTPIIETIIPTPGKSSEDVVKASDINENFKNEFPRREFIKAFWSKVVIEHNGRFNSKDILNQMFESFFQDVACYMCYYKTGELEDSFMLYMNFAPMNMLVVNNLKMEMKGSNEFVTFRLHLKCSTFTKGEIKWNELIGKVVNKRINSAKLDLSYFQRDPDFKDLIFTLKAADVKKYILQCALNINPKIIEINLSNNDLNSFKGLGIIKAFPDLFSLNLSQNNIDSLFGFPEKLKIVELNVDQNPLCDKFKTITSTTFDYVKVFTSLCPQLQYIDGRKIDQNFKMIHMQNYYTTSIAHNTIESFLNYFFKNFDNNLNRMTVCDALYRSDTILSVSSEYGKILKIGNEDIKRFYQDFPITEHDFITMTTDTPLFNSHNILIVVNGIFKQRNFHSMNEEDKIFTFSRTFMLRKEKRNNGRRARTAGTLSETYNYEIQNEIFHYAILNESRIKLKAFKKQRATDDEIELVFDHKDTAKNEFAANMELFRQTTLLSEKWCQRFLEDANGDFAVALNLFLELYKLRFFKKEDFKF